MFVIEAVSHRDIYSIPAIIACLVATDQQYRRAPGVERIERPERSPTMLGPQLSHMPVTGTIDAAAVGVAQ